MSAAKAAGDHMRNWWNGTSEVIVPVISKLPVHCIELNRNPGFPWELFLMALTTLPPASCFHSLFVARTASGRSFK